MLDKIHAKNLNRAAGGLHDSQDHINRRRLARTIWPEQSDYLPRRDRKRNAVHRDGFFIRFAKIFYCKNRLLRHGIHCTIRNQLWQLLRMARILLRQTDADTQIFSFIIDCCLFSAE